MEKSRKRKGLLRRTRTRFENLADSPLFTDRVADLLAGRVRNLAAQTDWTIEGRDGLAAEVAAGQPVIMALWHGRLPMSPSGWDPEWGPICVVTSSARPGRMVGSIMKRFGLGTMPMRDRKSNTSASLQVARMTRDGCSIGFAVDGPIGPKRLAKSVPIDWSRLTGCPIWLYTNSFERFRQLPGWDRPLVPKGRTRGCMLYRRWDVEVPKRLDPETREALRQRLQTDLDALTQEADQMMGHPKLVN